MDREHTSDSAADSLERQIDAWRTHLRRSRALAGPDVEELEDHLRERIDSLVEQGLSEDEAFLVAVKRMGAIDALTREFAREHSERLWKQLVLCGAAGAIVVATWLVEAKQSVIENMAPVLARIFIPLFALVLLAFVVTMVATGRGIDVEREILIAVDLLLVVVFGLLLYSISARDPREPPGPFDWLQLTLVGTALVVDVLALWAIGNRISTFGFTPNRIAGLGVNVVLLVDLAGSAFLYARFLRGGGTVTRLWDWQMSYLSVLAGWAAVVAFLFPFLFDFA